MFHTSLCVLGFITLLWVAIRWIPAIVKGTPKERLAEPNFYWAYLALIAHYGCFFLLLHATDGLFDSFDWFATMGYSLAFGEATWSLTLLCNNKR